MLFWKPPLLSILVFSGILVCIFGSDPLSHAEFNAKTHEGLSTASDTVQREAESITLDGLNSEEMRNLRGGYVNKSFGAAVDSMMRLIINSLYRNKEIFLRELISNASDALEKLRFLSLENPKLLDGTEELCVRIKADKDSRTLHIIDSGIGMTKDDLINNLGTIAKSGTLEFLESASKARSDSDKSDLIGQFGVGFYSSFLVADRVVVVSKHSSDVQYVWESDSKSFSYAKDPRGDTLKRGTEIILHLNDESSDFLEPTTLKRLIQASQFINFPIYLWNNHTQKVESDDDAGKSTMDEDASVEDEKKQEDKTEQRLGWEHVNAQKPIWKKQPSEISEKEYSDLYRALASSTEDPLAKVHFTAQGDFAFTSVLYIPRRSPPNMLSTSFSSKDRVKVFVHQVHIRDVADELLPRYLAFVLGLIDSDDIPINASRETIQQIHLTKSIRKKLVRKVLDLIGKLSEDDFETFWKQYSVAIKLGIIEDQHNLSRLSKLLRYQTSKTGEKLSSLADYVSRMKSGQKVIYYLTASSMDEAKSSLFTERLLKQGFEVVYMTDPIDEYVMQTLTEYEKTKFQNVAKVGVSIDEASSSESRKKEFGELMDWLSNDALKDIIARAEISERLAHTPCALVAEQYGWSANTRRVLGAQAYQNTDETAANFYSNMKMILEVNPRHPIIKELNSRIQADKADKRAVETAKSLFDLATLLSGFPLKDTPGFANRMESFMRVNLDIDPDEAVEEEVVPDETVERQPDPVSDEMDHKIPSPDSTESIATRDDSVYKQDENSSDSPKDEL